VSAGVSLTDASEKRTMTELLPYTCDLARAMIFIDGENLAIRYASILKQRNEAK